MVLYRLLNFYNFCADKNVSAPFETTKTYNRKMAKNQNKDYLFKKVSLGSAWHNLLYDILVKPILITFQKLI